MGKRILTSLAAGLFVSALILAFRGWDPTRDPFRLREGSGAPVAWSRISGEGVVVGWTFELKDGLSCNQTVGALRRAQRKFGSKVKFAAVAVEVDSAIAEAFLRKERISAELTYLTFDEYREQFGSDHISTVYLVNNGVIADVYSPDGAKEVGKKAPTGYSAFEEEVARLLGEIG